MFFLIQVLFFLCLSGFATGLQADVMTKDKMNDWWLAMYPEGELGTGAVGAGSKGALFATKGALFSTLARELLAKAAPDECFHGIGDPANNYDPDLELPCSDGVPKVNQSYVWGLTKSGDDLWFGTAPNVHCLVLGGYLGMTAPNENSSWACEFGSSQFSPPLPPTIGDWRPPRIFHYNTQDKNLVENTPEDPRIEGTLGFRSAGALGDVVILGGPGMLGGINLFAFNSSDGSYLGSTTLAAYNNIRKWLVVDDILYAAVGKTAGGGAVLRWTGNLSDPFQFENVGNLNGDGAELAEHLGKLYVSTWPSGGGTAGVWMSPEIPSGGLTEVLHKDSWIKVWAAEDYEPDPVTASTYGGGALASFGGYLYWGTMHVPMMATMAHFNVYGPPVDNEAVLYSILGTWRAISIFRGKDFETSTPTVDLLYGLPVLPKYTDGTGWETVPNNMGATPMYGLSGFGNFFNNYTWTMSVFDNQLFVGTMDWSYLALNELVRQFVESQTGTILDILPEEALTWPYSLFGADLFRFPSADHPAFPESLNGVENYSNYGIRTMLSDDALYLGMANPMNLFPLGGWELLKLTAGDGDGDGVENDVEDGAPNGGDGNGDGKDDSSQANVASLLSATGNGYVTVAATGGCFTIAAVQSFEEVPDDPEYDYPFGLVGFQFQGCSCATTVRIYFHGIASLAGYEYRKYGPMPPDFNNPVWYEMPGVTFGSANIGGQMTAYAEFTLEDGMLGDDTWIDGVIFDKGGPAVPNVPIPTINEWGIVIFMLFLSLVTFYITRKRGNFTKTN